MTIELKIISLTQRQILENLFNYYIYDLSDLFNATLGEGGIYRYNHKQIDIYWQAPDHFPYFIYNEDSIAGFALIRRYPPMPAHFDVEQFFVLKQHRRQGVAKRAIKRIFTQHPGIWITRVMPNNLPAVSFWETVIKEQTENNYEKTEKLEGQNDTIFFEFRV